MLRTFRRGFSHPKYVNMLDAARVRTGDDADANADDYKEVESSRADNGARAELA